MTHDTDSWLAVRHRVRRAVGRLPDRDAFWLALGVSAAAAVYAAYLFTHPYPAYGAGLYLDIADAIRRHGYGLPRYVSGYAVDPLPLAYPPLWFYVAAVVRDVAGIGGFAYSTLFPGVVVIATVVPFYYTARELLGSRREAGVASVLLAASPQVLQWHLSAGGIVRAPAFLLTVTGLYTGVRLFRDGQTRWLVASTALFALTVLSHPVYTVFFGLSYLLLFASESRTSRGLVHGAAVAVGGVALASPWWMQVVAFHGPGVFAAAAGTHGGIANASERLAVSAGVTLETGFLLVGVAGALVVLARGRPLLPVWLAASHVVVGKTRFLFVAGSMLGATLLVGRRPFMDGRRRFRALFVVALLCGAVLTGVLFGASQLDSHGGETTQPAFVDDHDRAAMAWLRTNTAGDATLVVLGDAAEWTPSRTGRRILVGPWGVEWTTPERYATQLRLFKDLSRCERAACLDAGLAAAGVTPDYIYVPKGHYTVRGFDERQSRRMRRTLVADERYDLRYENQGVMVFAVRNPDGPGVDRGNRTAVRPPDDERGGVGWDASSDGQRCRGVHCLRGTMLVGWTQSCVSASRRVR